MRSAKKLGDEDGLFQTSKEMYEVMGDDIESFESDSTSAARSRMGSVEDLASLGMENDAIRDESTRWMAESISSKREDGL